MRKLLIQQKRERERDRERYRIFNNRGREEAGKTINYTVVYSCCKNGCQKI